MDDTVKEIKVKTNKVLNPGSIVHVFFFRLLAKGGGLHVFMN